MKVAVLNPIERVVSLAKAVTRIDGWKNILTGLGVKNKDRRTGADYYWEPIQESDAEYLFAADDIARRVVSFPVEEGTREWIRLRLRNQNDPGLIQKVNDDLERLEAQGRIAKAWEWARLYGGAAIFLAVDDGKPLIEPLDLKAIRSIRALTVLSRHELNPMRMTEDLGHPNFGRPELYSLTPRTSGTIGVTYGSAVHYTRLLRFDGVSLPRTLSEVNEHWGDSVLTKLLEVLKDFNMSYGSVANTIQDFRVGVIRLKNLADLVAGDKDSDVMKRVQLMNATRSVLSAILLDADSESFEQTSTTLTGLKDVLDKMDMRLVAATDLPHTVILGQGATGSLSGGGQSEDRNITKVVEGLQEKHLTKPLNRLIEIVQAARQGPTGGRILPDLTWVFNPISQPTEKEKADVHKSQAEADKIYWEMGAVDAEEIAKSRFGGDEFSTETSLDTETRKAPGPVQGLPAEPAEAAAAAAAGAEAPATPEGVIEKEIALNGAQVTSLIQTIEKVAGGLIPRETGLEIMMTAFALEREQAERLMGQVGLGFKPAAVASPAAPTFDEIDPENHGHYDPAFEAMTGPSTGMHGPNHVHRRANGADTGPAISLPNGAHIHSLGRVNMGGFDTEMFSAPEEAIVPMPIEERIDVVREEEGQWYVFSKAGKKLAGPYSSQAAAEKRLGEIEHFKRKA